MKNDKNNIVDPKATIAGRRYHPEKPWSCVFCHYWISRKKGCKLNACHYLLPDKTELPEDTGNCKNCPYGRNSPCIGYCIAKLLMEIRQKKGRRTSNE